MGAFLRGVFLLRPAGFPDDGGKGGDELFMNAPEFDGGEGDLGAVSVLVAPVQVNGKVVQITGTAPPPFLRSGGEGSRWSGGGEVSVAEDERLRNRFFEGSRRGVISFCSCQETAFLLPCCFFRISGVA